MNAVPFMDYFIHFCIGCGGAVTARCAIGLCNHFWHRVIVGGILLMVETAVTVQIIG